MAELLDVPVTETEKKGPMALAPLARRARPPSDPGWTPTHPEIQPDSPTPPPPWGRTDTKQNPDANLKSHAAKRGFKNSPGFFNSTGWLGPKKGRKCYITPAFSGFPKQKRRDQKSIHPLGVTMMPLGAPSVSKYRSLGRILALRAPYGLCSTGRAHRHAPWNYS